MRRWRLTDSRSLVSLGMDILRLRSRGIWWLLAGSASGELGLQKLQASLDVYIAWIEVGGTSICIQSIGNLVVARFI